MIYEVTVKINSEQYRNLNLPMVKIKPIYKPEYDNHDEEWIRAHSGLILGGAVANSIYQIYHDDFKDREILSRTKFYKTCRELLNVEMKNIRNGDSVEYHFTTPKG